MKLQLVHSDFYGLRSPTSLTGSKYFIKFINNMTQMCWIYILTFKYEVPEVFWKFKTLVQNQGGCRIQMLRSNNGTEYTSDRFKK